MRQSAAGRPAKPAGREIPARGTIPGIPDRGDLVGAERLRQIDAFDLGTAGDRQRRDLDVDGVLHGVPFRQLCAKLTRKDAALKNAVNADLGRRSRAGLQMG